MRFFKGISALDYSGNESAPLQKEGGTIGIIRRIEPIPGKLLPSRACFRLAQRSNVLNQILYLQPVEKDGHILFHFRFVRTIECAMGYASLNRPASLVYVQSG